MTTVAVCGASLLTSIIADHLAATPSITVVPIDPNQPGATTRLLAAHPDVALIERSAGDAAHPNDRLLLALLHTGIDFPLVTLDAGAGVALLTSHALGVESIEALVEWVEEGRGAGGNNFGTPTVREGELEIGSVGCEGGGVM